MSIQLRPGEFFVYPNSNNIVKSEKYHNQTTALLQGADIVKRLCLIQEPHHSLLEF